MLHQSVVHLWGWPLCVSMIELNQSMYHRFSCQILSQLDTIEMSLGLNCFSTSLRLFFIIFFEIYNRFKKGLVEFKFLLHFSDLRWWDKRCFFYWSPSTSASITIPAFTFMFTYLRRYKYFFEIYCMVFGQIIGPKVAKPSLISIDLKISLVVISGKHFIHI
jgi:hypothetical protein